MLHFTSNCINKSLYLALLSTILIRGWTKNYKNTSLIKILLSISQLPQYHIKYKNKNKFVCSWAKLKLKFKNVFIWGDFTFCINILIFTLNCTFAEHIAWIFALTLLPCNQILNQMKCQFSILWLVRVCLHRR